MLCLRRTLITICFQVLQMFFEYRGKSWTGTILKFMEKLVFPPVSWVFCLLFQHYQHLSFLVWERVLCRLLKESTVSSALVQSLVLFKFRFSKKLYYFDKNSFPLFRALLKQKGQSGKKIVNSRNFIFRRTLMALYFQVPEKIFK